VSAPPGEGSVSCAPPGGAFFGKEGTAAGNRPQWQEAKGALR
jgi:hypothetical protein